MTIAVRHTWFMVGRQLRNLMREPIWIALLLVQPMVWLLLYGQLFKRVTNLPGGGFGTSSYITFLAPAIVIMNSFFGATWSGMAMISDLDRDVLPRFLATPVSRISLVVSQIVRSALIAVIGRDHPARVPGTRRAGARGAARLGGRARRGGAHERRVRRALAGDRAARPQGGDDDRDR